MSAYQEIWKFTRERLDQAFQDLNDEQLRWRPFEGGHNIGEMIFHIAGVEAWFATRFLEMVPNSPDEMRLISAARDSFITEVESPFADNEMTVEFLKETLAKTSQMIEPILANPKPEFLEKPIETVIGPIVPGIGCYWRLAQHSAYHTGQIWTYRMMPNFPQS